MKKLTRLAIGLGASALMLASPAALAGAAKQAVASSEVAPDPAAVAALLAILEDAIAKLGANPAQADVEAALSFAIDQQANPPAVIRAALSQLFDKTKSRKLRMAIASVRADRAGTGGLADAGSLVSGGVASLGSAPAVGGGGGSDYSTTN